MLYLFYLFAFQSSVGREREREKTFVFIAVESSIHIFLYLLCPVCSTRHVSCHPWPVFSIACTRTPQYVATSSFFRHGRQTDRQNVLPSFQDGRTVHSHFFCAPRWASIAKAVLFISLSHRFLQRIHSKHGHESQNEEGAEFYRSVTPSTALRARSRQDACTDLSH